MRPLIGKLLVGSLFTSVAHLAGAQDGVAAVASADWLVLCGVVIGAAIALRRLNG